MHTYSQTSLPALEQMGSLYMSCQQAAIFCFTLPTIKYAAGSSDNVSHETVQLKITLPL